jgi:hypothetical protein
MTPPLSVNIIYNKTNTFGLTDDINVIERLLRKLQDSVGHRIGKARLLDMREPLIHCDIQFHLEIPVFGAISWAHTNILLVNPEQWSYSYDSYVHSFDALIFRDPSSADKFRAAFAEKGIRNDHIYVVPWCAALQLSDIKYSYGQNGDQGFVCFIAGSKSKYEYVRQLLPYWKAEDPALTIYTTSQDYADNLKKNTLASNVNIIQAELTLEQRSRLMAQYRGHLVCSEGESYGYAAANAEVYGAFTIMNSLPAFEYTYENSMGITWLFNNYTESTKVRYSFARPTDNAGSELSAAFETFKKLDLDDIRRIRQKVADNRFSTTSREFLPLLKNITSLVKERRPSKGIFHCPPVLNIDDCPPISIVTPTYNREKLIDIAFHNLLSTDYPHNKIEWIVVEDNEKTPHLASEKIISFQIQVPDIKLKYIPIEGRMTIGEKRNIAIEHASHDIILFMDDDDHYPSTSFRRRVAWLTKGTKRGETGKANIVCCTTLALYDLKFGTSAVNVPPFEIPFSQRISEATLTFKKSAWVERKFPNVSIAEGEDWIQGREDQVIEIPPQQIIVAFSHGNNQSSRRIPPSENKPACFWGFPKEYLIFIHKLAGVDVEEDTKPAKSNKPKKN